MHLGFCFLPCLVRNLIASVERVSGIITQAQDADLIKGMDGNIFVDEEDLGAELPLRERMPNGNISRHQRKRKRKNYHNSKRSIRPNWWIFWRILALLLG